MKNGGGHFELESGGQFTPKLVVTLNWNWVVTLNWNWVVNMTGICN